LITLVLWLVGEIFRDATLFTGFLFYIPSPFVAALFVSLGFHLAIRKKIGSTLLFLGLGVVPAVFVFGPETRWSGIEEAAPAGKKATIVHWNVCYGLLGWGGVGEALREIQADIYVLSEAIWLNDVRLIEHRLPPGFEVAVSYGMVIAARGGVHDLRQLVNEEGTRIFSASWNHEGRNVEILVVDLGSDPFCARDPKLNRVVGFIRERSPDIVVGDFNSPRRSLALAALPDGYCHAYDVAGRGWGYTWPTLCPIFAIDQCIVGPRIVPHRYDLESSLHSDHRMQVLEFSIEDGDEGTRSGN